jgi:hypothetical protein
MSTTTDIGTAAAYSVNESGLSLIFRIITENNLTRGADLQWLSAFPSEAEILFPPLTFLMPTGRSRKFEIKGHSITVVEVRPTVTI